MCVCIVCDFCTKGWRKEGKQVEIEIQIELERREVVRGKCVYDEPKLQLFGLKFNFLLNIYHSICIVCCEHLMQFQNSNDEKRKSLKFYIV